MDTKRKLFFAVISMILLSATALAVPVADHKSEIPHVVTNIKTPEAAFFIIPSSTTPLTIKFIDQSTGSPTFFMIPLINNTADNKLHRPEYRITYFLGLELWREKYFDSSESYTYLLQSQKIYCYVESKECCR